MRKVAGGLRSRLARRKLASEPEAAEGGEAKRTVVDRELKLCSELEFLCAEFGKSVQHTMRLLVRFWRALQKFGAEAFEPEEARIVEENFMALRKGLDSTSLSVFHTLMQTKGFANKARKSLRELEPKLVARDRAWVQKEHYSNKVAEIRLKLSEQNLAGRPILEEQLRKLQMNEAKQSEAQDAYEVAKVETWAFGKTRKDLVAILILSLDTITRDWFICAGEQVSTALRNPKPPESRQQATGRHVSQTTWQQTSTEDPHASLLGSSSASGAMQTRPFLASDIDLGEDVEIDLGSPFHSPWDCRTASEDLLPSFWDGDGDGDEEDDDEASPSRSTGGSRSPSKVDAPSPCGGELVEHGLMAPSVMPKRPGVKDHEREADKDTWRSEVRSMQEEMRALLKNHDEDRRAQQELMDHLKSSFAGGSSTFQGSSLTSEQGTSEREPKSEPFAAASSDHLEAHKSSEAASSNLLATTTPSTTPLTPEQQQQEADRWRRKLGPHLASSPSEASQTQEAHDDFYCLRVTVAYLNEVESELKTAQKETWKSDLRFKSEARQSMDLREELRSEALEVERLSKLVDPDVNFLMEELRDAQVETKKAEMRAAAAARCWGR
mmetsp:Transcript_53762/g.114765  ORF Transcript_53762/g.114765 Transcript_53762/m.114765 type:complete len:609 (+) Transcript_53762:78-1904(+)